jgi:hypothetical protein
VKEEEYMNIVKQAWETERGINQKGVQGAMKGVLGELASWSKNMLGDLEKRISKLKKELESWRRKGIGPKQFRREGLIRVKLSQLEDQ